MKGYVNIKESLNVWFEGVNLLETSNYKYNKKWEEKNDWKRKKYYERFKSNEISNENLKKGEAKVRKLGSEKENEFFILMKKLEI